MASASLVDSMSQAKGITLYGNVTGVGQYLARYRSAQKVSFELCSLDVAVRASEAWTPC